MNGQTLVYLDSAATTQKPEAVLAATTGAQLEYVSVDDLTEACSQFDAEHRFWLAAYTADEPEECQSGLVLQGLRTPHECPAFGTRCTPEHPMGAMMVSTEGACSVPPSPDW